MIQKILTFLLSFYLLFQISPLFWNTWEDSISSETQVETGETTTNEPWIESVLMDKKESLDGMLKKSPEDKDIEYVENLLKELEIKKEVNNSFLIQIQSELEKIQKKIDSNDSKIKTYSELEAQNVEINKELESLKKESQKLKEESFFKESLIKDLKDTIDSYNLLEVKYKNLLDSYVVLKKEKQGEKLKDFSNKLKILYFWILFFLLFYWLKILIQKTKLKNNVSESFFAYYDLFYATLLIIFIIAYLFFVFPQMYILLVFISWSIIITNAVLISSFVSSIIIFRKFSIGDIIKMDQETGKIIKITPLHTIIRRINEHGIIEKDEISIPNINLIKDKVNVIKNIHEKDHHFSIILSLRTSENIFKIIDEIKNEILLKNLNHRLTSVNKLDEDIFKTKYEQIDAENIKINFYWIWNDELNRKIEMKIIWYIKNIFFSKSNNDWQNSSDIQNIKSNWDKKNTDNSIILTELPKVSLWIMEEKWEI